MTHEQQLVKILQEIKRICERNNIKYVLVGGTLRGAITNGKCIPGDSDIDIGVLRVDYLRLLEHLDELSPEFYATNYMLDDTFKETFTKIFNIEGNAYADIQPFDNAPKHKVSKFVQWFLFKVFCKIAIVMQLVNFKSFANILLKAQKLVQEYFNNKESDIAVSLNSRHGYKEFFAKTDFENTMEVMFEGDSYPASINSMEYLRRVYGGELL